MFNNPVVGGLQLVRNAIQSVNYVPGVSGWAINRDGTAEFATGTFRGPVVIVDPITGDILATIGADGDAAFQTVDATDFLLNGESLATLLGNLGRGIVAQYKTTSSLPTPGLSGSFTSACWTQFEYDTSRLYRVTTSSTYWNNTAAVTEIQLTAKVLFNQPSITGGASNETVHQTVNLIQNGKNAVQTISFYLGGSSGRANGTSTLALQLTTDGGSTFNSGVSSTNAFYFTVEDVGPLPAVVGGSGAPSGLLTYTVNYTAIGSRSYDGDGIYIGAPDGDNNIYLSTFADRAYVNERFQVLFDGDTIRTDLSGATIAYARLWLYCFKAEETKGSLGFAWSTLSSISSSFNGTFVGEVWAKDDHWPVPGWNYFDLLTEGGGHTCLSEILDDGGNSIVSRQPLIPGLAATGWRGYGTSAYRPYLEIKYTGNAPSSSGGYGTSGYGTGGYGI